MQPPRLRLEAGDSAFALALAALAFALLSPLAGLWAGAQIEWRLSITGPNVGVAAPIHVSVVAFSPETGENYTAECRLVLVHPVEGVHLTEEFAGAPARTVFRVDEPAIYELYLKCRALLPEGEGEETPELEYRANINVYVPSFTVEPEEVRWGRPARLTISSDYPYTGVNVEIDLGLLKAASTMSGGVATVEIPPLPGPEHPYVLRVGGVEVAEGVLRVTPPRLSIALAPQQVKPLEQAVLAVALEDDEGPLLHAVPTSLSVEGPCEPSGELEVRTGDAITLEALAPGICTVEASAEVAGTPLSASASLTVEPPKLRSFQLSVERLGDSWDYRVEARAETDWLAPLRLTVYVDGEPVAGRSVELDDFIYVEAILRDVRPGPHTVTAVLESPWLPGSPLERSLEFVAPRRPYPWSPPPEPIVIPLGGDPRPLLGLPEGAAVQVYRWGGSWWVEWWWPGDDYYLPLQGSMRVEVVEPFIYARERGDAIVVSVSGAAPGAVVALLCGDRVIEEWVVGEAGFLLAELAEEPACPQGLRVEYRYGWATLAAPVSALGEPFYYYPSCTAYTPCPAPYGRSVLYTVIAGRAYEPGEAYVLPPGEYLALVYLDDGSVEPVTLRVTDPGWRVYVYVLDDEGRVVRVVGPGYVKVELVLASGRVVELGRGVHTLPEPVIAVAGPRGVAFLVRP